MGYIELNLKQGAKVFPLRQVAPDWFIPDQRLNLSGKAVLCICVDGVTEEIPINIIADKQGRVYYKRKRQPTTTELR